MSAEQQQNASGGQLERRLGFRDATVVIVGNMIGAGIFIMPPVVANASGDGLTFLGLWLLGGVIAFAGAMSSAELGILMPHAGGDYIFLRRTYGLAAGFLYGYLSLFFSYTGSIAAMATAVSSFQGGTLLGGDTVSLAIASLQLPGIGEWRLELRHLIACGLVIGVTTVNHFGIMRGIFLQRIATFAPAAALAIIAIAALGAAVSGSGSIETLRANLTAPSSTPAIGALGLGLLPVFFAYTGWNVTLYLAEDIKAPHRNIPLSMLVGVGLVTALYLLFCFSLLASAPFGDLRGDFPRDVSSTAASVFLGEQAGTLMAVVIALFIVSSLNTTVLGGSRLYLAMARDRVFFEAVGRVHPRYQSPWVALWLQAGLACALILIVRDLDAILNLAVLVMLALSALTISCVFILRRRLGKEHAVHAMENRLLARALGYPLLPAFYILALLAIIVAAGLYDATSMRALIAAGLMTGIGLLAYAAWRRWQQKRAPH